MASSMVVFLGTRLHPFHSCDREEEMKHGGLVLRSPSNSFCTSLASHLKLNSLSPALKLPIFVPVFSELAKTNQQQLPNSSFGSFFKGSFISPALKLPIFVPVFSELAKTNQQQVPNSSFGSFFKGSFISFLLAFAILASSIPAPSPSDTYQDVPSDISGTEKRRRIQKPKSAKAESCTRKCVATCIRSGGEGPLNVRKPLIVFKEEFRSRQYCLVECSEICNLIGEGDDGP